MPSPGRRDTPPRVRMKSGRVVVGGDVDWLRISRGVAERLHDQVSGEAQASQVFQLVAGHRTSGVLGADGGHLRFAVGARTHAFAFWQANSALPTIFCARVKPLVLVELEASGRLEQVGWRRAGPGTRRALSRSAPRPMISVDTAASLRTSSSSTGVFISKVVSTSSVPFFCKLCSHSGYRSITSPMSHVGNVEFDWQSAGSLPCVL